MRMSIRQSGWEQMDPWDHLVLTTDRHGNGNRSVITGMPFASMITVVPKGSQRCHFMIQI